MENGYHLRFGAHIGDADHSNHLGRNTSVFPSLGDTLRCPVPVMASDIARLLVNLNVPAYASDADSIGRISLLLGNTLYAVAFGYYTVICFLGYNGMVSSSKIADRPFSLIMTLASSTLPPPHGIASLARLCLRHSMDHQSLRLQYS